MITLETNADENKELQNLKKAIGEAAIVSVANLMGKITYANDRFIEISGYSKEELIHQNHRVVKSDVHDADFFKDMWKTISSGKVWRGEICNRTKQGSYYWVDSTIVPFLDDKGKPEAYMGIRFLITDKKNLVSQLSKANVNQEKIIQKRTRELHDSTKLLMQTEKMAALGELVSGVAHEINTPIGNSVTATSLLEEEINQVQKSFQSGQMTKTQFEQFLQDAYENTRIIQSNLEKAALQIRSFKQVATDQSVEDKRDFNVHDYLKEILLSLRPQLKKTAISVNIDCDETLVIESYAGVISQILSNFITNSVRYAFEPAEAGSIDIGFTLESGNARLSYRDNGKGLDRKTLKKLFDPFYTTGRSQGGTGLGMHIVYNLVTQKLEGSIRVASEPGEGLRFEIEFPVN